MSVLKGLGIDLRFDAIFGGDSIPEKKPHPGPLIQVLTQFGVSPVRGLIVGDGETDIQAGKRAGVYTCGVTYGLGKMEELVGAKPDFLIDDIYQLTEHFY
jgi:phosphoglycolate phosphatase-like HAD superfamily hydrolase